MPENIRRYRESWQHTLNPPAGSDTQDIAAQLAAAGLALTSASNTMLDHEIANTHHEVSQTITEMVGIVIATIIAGALISWRMTRQLTLPLRRTLATAERIAAGDLTMHNASHSFDEVGQLSRAIEGMNKNLHGIIGNIREGVTQVSRASGEIAAGNIDLSARTEEQAAALGQTAASMEELTSTVKQNADNATSGQPAGIRRRRHRCTRGQAGE